MKRLSLIFTLFALIMADATAAVKRYYVATNGTDGGKGTIDAPFRTIKYAASRAVAGDTVLIKGGVYSENEITPKSGTADKMITFKPANRRDSVFMYNDVDSASGKCIFVFDRVNYVRVDGLNFRGYKYGGTFILNNGARGNQIINCRFEDIGTEWIGTWPTMSVICINKSHYNIVSNCFFRNIYGDGVGIGDNSTYNVCTYNSFYNFEGKRRGWAPNGHFSNCMGAGTTSYGHNIYAFNYGNNVVDLLWFDRDGSTNIVIRNEAEKSGLLFFNESRCARNIAQENVAWNMKWAAFQTAQYETGYTPDPRWVHNVVYNSGGGFILHKTYRNEMRGNIAFDNGNQNVSMSEIAASDTCGPHHFAYNDWYTRAAVNIHKYKNKAVSFQTFADYVGEENSMSRNPLFTNPSKGDFTLKPNSPCRGAGLDGVDMGAYPVYPKIPVGMDAGRFPDAALEVTLDSAHSIVSRGNSIVLTARLNKAADTPVSVSIEPVAGEAVEGTDYTVNNRTVTFKPGETSKYFAISFSGASSYEKLLALRLCDAQGASVGCRDSHVARISAGSVVPRLWMEAEDMKTDGHGSAWTISESADCGNNKFVQFDPGKLRVYPFAAADSTHYLAADFNVDDSGTYYIFMRVNTQSATSPQGDDTFYFMIDDEPVTMYNSGFDNPEHIWVWINPYGGGKELTAGSHQLKIVGCENGFQLDRICVARTADKPQGMGGSPTAIHNIEHTQHEAGNNNVYDISGRIVSRNADLKNLPRGLYIHKGRKIIIK